MYRLVSEVDIAAKEESLRIPCFRAARGLVVFLYSLERLQPCSWQHEAFTLAATSSMIEDLAVGL